MFAKAVASKWRHFSVRVNECFAPEFVVSLVSCCLVRVTQWRNMHLCSGLDQNGNIGRLTGGKKKQISQPQWCGYENYACTVSLLKDVSLSVEIQKKSASKVYFGQDLVCNNLFGIGQISIYLRSDSSNRVEIFVTGTMSHENCYTIFSG